MRFTELALASSPQAALYYRVHKALDWLCTIAADFFIFYRKETVAPSGHHMDHSVHLATIIPTLVGKLSCVIGARPSCWVIEIDIMAITGAIAFLYYDAFYLYKVLKKGRELNLPHSVMSEVIKPVVWTTFMYLAVMIGSIMFVYGKANFYSNIFWSLATTIYPIMAIQGTLDTHSSEFYHVMRRHRRKDIGDTGKNFKVQEAKNTTDLNGHFKTSSFLFDLQHPAGMSRKEESTKIIEPTKH